MDLPTCYLEVTSFLLVVCHGGQSLWHQLAPPFHERPEKPRQALNGTFSVEMDSPQVLLFSAP